MLIIELGLSKKKSEKCATVQFLFRMVAFIMQSGHQRSCQMHEEHKIPGFSPGIWPFTFNQRESMVIKLTVVSRLAWKFLTHCIRNGEEHVNSYEVSVFRSILTKVAV
jgi:hypothetical protein